MDRKVVYSYATTRFISDHSLHCYLKDNNRCHFEVIHIFELGYRVYLTMQQIRLAEFLKDTFYITRCQVRTFYWLHLETCTHLYDNIKVIKNNMHNNNNNNNNNNNTQDFYTET